MPLNDPIGSSAFDVLQRNTQDFDKFTNQTSGAVTLRLGESVTPLPVRDQQIAAKIALLGLTRIEGATFKTGATVPDNSSLLLWATADGGTGFYYYFSGEIPGGGKIVPPNSTPASTGGTGAGGWLVIDDLESRLANGAADIGAAKAADLAKATINVPNLKALASIPSGQRRTGITYRVMEFNTGTGIGGHDLKWNQTRSWTSSDIGLVWPDVALNAWDGTAAGLSALYGSFTAGIGCWEKLSAKGTNPDNFGALGVGTSNDDTLAFRKAGQHTAAGAEMKASAGRHYYLVQQSDGKTLEFNHGFVINFNGSQVTYKTWGSDNPASNHRPAIFFNADMGSVIDVDPIEEDSTTITATDSDVSSLSAGDFIAIFCTATRRPWNWPDSELSSFGGWGEVGCIKSINNTTKTITLFGRTQQDYPATARIQKINMIFAPAVMNVKGQEVDPMLASSKPLGADCGHFVSFSGCIMPTLRVADIKGHRMFVYFSDWCIVPTVEKVYDEVTNTTYPPIGGHAYQIRHQRSHNAYTANCVSRKSRHLLDYTSAYDSYSENNRGIGVVTPAYTTHGFGEKNITSVNDSFSDCGQGWSWGNPAFAHSKGFTLIGFNGNARNMGISIVSNSSDVNIIDPRITGRRALDVRQGAKDVKVSGKGWLYSSDDLEAVVVGNTQVILTRTVANTATATAGANPTVTCQFEGTAGIVAGSKLYVSFANSSEVAGVEYSGFVTVQSVSGTTVTFTFDDARTTTVNLNGGSLQYPVWLAGSFKPCRNFKMTGVKVGGLAAAGIAPISISCEGIVEIDVQIDSKSRQQMAILDSQSILELPKDFKLSLKAEQASCDRVVLMRSLLPSFSVRNTIAKGFTSAFLQFGYAVTNKSFLNGWTIEDNDFSAATPTTGVANFNLWDILANGGKLGGNTYPLNASLSHATNKPYENGTFTLSLKGSTATGTATYTQNTCKYKLVGNEIKFSGRLQWSAYNGTGNMTVEGFPFQFADTEVVSVAEVALSTATVPMPTASGSSINLRMYTNPVTWLQNQSAGDFRFSFSATPSGA